jgi:hypothetical protein
LRIGYIVNATFLSMTGLLSPPSYCAAAVVPIDLPFRLHVPPKEDVATEANATKVER